MLLPRVVCLLLLFVGFQAQAKEALTYNLFLSESKTRLIGFIENSSDFKSKVVLPKGAAELGVRPAPNVNPRYQSLLANCPSLARWETGRLQLAPKSCRGFSLPLRVDVDRWGYRSADLVNQRWQVSNDDWLVKANKDLRVALYLPEGFQVSVPWPTDGTSSAVTFTVSPAALNERGLLLFGEFININTNMAGVGLNIAYLANPKDYDKIYFWLQHNFNQMVATLSLSPTPFLQVIITPATGNNPREPVPFGHVLRAGNQAVQFFVNTTASYEAFIGDWTAAHEFSHLMLPYLGNSGRWISEGFAGYYGYVIMAHMGQYSEQHAWQKLLTGFRQAKAEWPKVTPNESYDRGMGSHRMMIYWSGAAIALMADVKIRELSNGEQSLNSVLAELAECCLPSSYTWTNEQLFTQLDQFTPEPIFMPLYDQFADDKGFPAVEATLESLGIEHRGMRRVRLGDGALQHIRRQIMQAPKG